MDVMKAIIKETKFKISIRVHPFEAIQGYEDNLKDGLVKKIYIDFI